MLIGRRQQVLMACLFVFVFPSIFLKEQIFWCVTEYETATLGKESGDKFVFTFTEVVLI